ncbi:MAG: rhodanese-like domain-containing protein [Flavobacteriales bacterium]
MLRSLFGIGPKVDIPQLLAQGATIVDVRTREEYAGGHVKGSKNIPLDELLTNLHSIAKGKPVITCCASGMRSNSAAGVLRDHGFDAHNGGPWTRVQAALSAR